MIFQVSKVTFCDSRAYDQGNILPFVFDSWIVVFCLHSSCYEVDSLKRLVIHQKCERNLWQFDPYLNSRSKLPGQWLCHESDISLDKILKLWKRSTFTWFIWFSILCRSEKPYSFECVENMTSAASVFQVFLEKNSRIRIYKFLLKVQKLSFPPSSSKSSP